MMSAPSTWRSSSRRPSPTITRSFASGANAKYFRATSTTSGSISIDVVAISGARAARRVGIMPAPRPMTTTRRARGANARESASPSV